MTALAIRAALETALDAISPPIATAWENDAFTPPDLETPYQEASLLLAQPDNAETGRQYTQRGFLQVNLYYPLGYGTGDVTARAELLKTTFRKTLSFTASGVTAYIDRTPEIIPGRRDDDRWMVPVRIYFAAQITT